MSDQKRYYLDDHGVLIEHPCGEYALYEDYARLKAEVERLRKAGDVMLLALWLGVDDYSKTEKEKAEDAWNAAKDGKPTE